MRPTDPAVILALLAGLGGAADEADRPTEARIVGPGPAEPEGPNARTWPQGWLFLRLCRPRTDDATRAEVPGRPGADPPVRRAQASPDELGGPGMVPPMPAAGLPATTTEIGTPVVGGQSISLQAALYGALTSNPDLVTLRQGTPTGPSPEAVEVARRFPTTLNPTLWLDYRPITLVPTGTFGTQAGAGSGTTTTRPAHKGFYESGQNYIYVSLRQPIELGHQTTHRYEIAKAALSQQQWTVVQAELTALVQTYRFFQTAAYRRERLRVASDLANFNDRLVEALRRRQEEANQALAAAADVVLAHVESRASRQQVKAARQDYLTALGDLRNQVGIPETAGAAEPLGEFTLPAYIPPIDERAMVELALQSRPDIRAARSQIAAAQAATRLARADRIPSPIIGPEYQMDEAGVQYIGLVYITAVPILNSGKPLVIQRQAEAQRACVALRQAEQRAASQVRAAVARWNGVTDLVNETSGLTAELTGEVERLDHLFEEGQTDLARVMQARQRLIQLENSRLDAVWAATQAQADLLLALGAPNLINAMLQQAEGAAAPATPPPTATNSPFRAPAVPNPPPPPATLE